MEETRETKQPSVIGWTPSTEELEIFDKLQRKFYTLNKSDILRKVFAIGSDELLKGEQQNVRDL